MATCDPLDAERISRWMKFMKMCASKRAIRKFSRLVEMH